MDSGWRTARAPAGGPRPRPRPPAAPPPAASRGAATPPQSPRQARLPAEAEAAEESQQLQLQRRQVRSCYGTVCGGDPALTAATRPRPRPRPRPRSWYCSLVHPEDRETSWGPTAADQRESLQDGAPMPALRALLSRRKGSPTMSSAPSPSSGGGAEAPAPPVAASVTSPRTASQLARAAFFASPPTPAPPLPSPPATTMAERGSRGSPEVSTTPSPRSPTTLRRSSGSTLSLGHHHKHLPRSLSARGRVKSADGLMADAAPLLARQPSSSSGAGRLRAVASCYNVLSFLRERTCQRPTTPRLPDPLLERLGEPSSKQDAGGLLLGRGGIRPINRLRIPGAGLCSRCSSILSLASSSRYSVHASVASFAPLSPTRTSSGSEELVLCKLCLTDVPESLTTRLHSCRCRYCLECMRTYVVFEILEGAYDISCPDAQCDRQGVISMAEIERLVEDTMVEKHKRFRLNREVERDASRTWCPRPGCETVCPVNTERPSGTSILRRAPERCQPVPVHCPSCDSDFCSACRAEWHPDAPSCEENQRRLAARGLLPDPPPLFDSDLIKHCPMCQVPIEKDEGCAQMMCKRCKHVFCWYCLASLDDDFLLRHYDKGPCKNKLGHSRASVIWHRTQVIGIFAGFGILLLVASPLLLLAAPCIVCCKCRMCGGAGKLDGEDDLPADADSAS